MGLIYERDEKANVPPKRDSGGGGGRGRGRERGGEGGSEGKRRITGIPLVTRTGSRNVG